MILHALGMFVADLFESRNRLEAENLFLRHQLNIASRRTPSRFRLRGSDPPGVIEASMTTSRPKAVKEGAQTPLGRLTFPDDVALVACFLASEDARFVTGEIIEVNGGFHFR